MVMPADSQAQVLPPGRVFFVREGTLFTQPFDLEHASPTGEPTAVENSVLSTNPEGFHAFSVSDTGHLAYRSGQVVETTQLTWTDRTGRVVGLVGKPDLFRNPALSTDDSRLAVELTDQVQRRQDIWLFDLVRNVLSRLTSNEGTAVSAVMPVWSPDNQRIAFASDRGAGSNLYVKATNSSSPEELLLDTQGRTTVPYSWSADGRFLLHRGMNGNFFNTALLPFAGDRTPRLYAARDYMLANSTVSPDGRFIAYNANETGRFEIFIESFPTPGTRWQVSREGGVHPRWRHDSRELYYYAADGNLMAATINPQATPQVGATVVLFRERLLAGPVVAVGFGPQYDVGVDGRFLLNVPVAAATTPAIHVVLNRFAQ